MSPNNVTTWQGDPAEPMTARRPADDGVRGLGVRVAQCGRHGAGHSAGNAAPHDPASLPDRWRKENARRNAKHGELKRELQALPGAQKARDALSYLWLYDRACAALMLEALQHLQNANTGRGDGDKCAL